MRFQVLLAIAVLALAGCPKEPDAPGPRPIVVPDTTECEAMCNHIGPQGLNCEEGQPVYNSDLPGPPGIPNQPCKDWCEEIQTRGTFLNPRCVKTVPTCDLIEEYRKKTCNG